jgi:hypothetical protein
MWTWHGPGEAELDQTDLGGQLCVNGELVVAWTCSVLESRYLPISFGIGARVWCRHAREVQRIQSMPGGRPLRFRHASQVSIWIQDREECGPPGRRRSCGGASG